MKSLIIVSLCFLLVPGIAYSTDWNQTRSQLELLQKVLEEKARAKRENRKADMGRLQREADQIQADKLRRHEQQQAEQRRQAEQQRLARERAYRNSAQYKHNQELSKAIRSEQQYGYGSSYPSQQPSSSTRYRPPQKTTPGYKKPTTSSSSRLGNGYASTGTTSASGSRTSQSYDPRPTGITTNPSRSNYTPGNSYDDSDLDASGVGLHDVTATSTSTSPAGGYGAPQLDFGKCLEWVEVEPYECGIYGMGGSTCTSRCVKREIK